LINLEGPDTEGFYLAADAADVVDGRITAITINNTPIILTRLNDTIHAFSALCPHASGDLTMGELHRGRIDCPDHGYRFDIRSGFPVWPPDEVCRLKKYPTKEKQGHIFVKVQAG
jgi:nitrite reductase/ring-hydroxylating ferredoxin subunit